MKKKYRIIVLVTLGLAAFGASLMFSLSRRSAPPPQAGGAGGQPGAGDLLADVAEKAAGQMQPKEAELYQLVEDVRAKMRELDRRERELEERARQLALAESILDKQAEELENLRLQLVAPLTSLKEATRRLAESRERIARQEQANLKNIAAKYEKLDEDAGSDILVSMCENGQEADAVKILYYLSERTTAKMLGAIPDRELAARLLERMKRIQEEG
jgi:chromosome segregation ATPase